MPKQNITSSIPRENISHYTLSIKNAGWFKKGKVHGVIIILKNGHRVESWFEENEAKTSEFVASNLFQYITVQIKEKQGVIYC